MPCNVPWLPSVRVGADLSAMSAASTEQAATKPPELRYKPVRRLPKLPASLNAQSRRFGADDPSGCENGFDGIDRNTRTAIIWVCERDEERDRYLLDTGYPINRESPHRFYQDRLDVIQAEDRRSQAQQVFDLVIAQPGISSIEIAEQTGIRSNTVGARLRDMEKNGTLARAGAAIYCMLNMQ